jgi:hypothetical protein
MPVSLSLLRQLEKLGDLDAWIDVPGDGKWRQQSRVPPSSNRLMNCWRRTGEYLVGRTFACPNSILVGDPSVMVAFPDIVRDKGYEFALRRTGE